MKCDYYQSSGFSLFCLTKNKQLLDRFCFTRKISNFWTDFALRKYHISGGVFDFGFLDNKQVPTQFMKLTFPLYIPWHLSVIPLHSRLQISLFKRPKPGENLKIVRNSDETHLLVYFIGWLSYLVLELQNDTVHTYVAWGGITNKCPHNTACTFNKQ